MKNKLVLVSLIALFAVGVAYAETAEEMLKYTRVTSQQYVDDAVADKQAKIGAESGDYAVIYPNSAGNDTAHDEAGEINKRHIAGALSGTGISNDDLPTVGAVNTGLDDKQQKLSGTSGDLVTYGASTGSVGSQKIYSSDTAYTGQQAYLVQAQHVNSAVSDGFSRHITCNQYDPANSTDDADCLLWVVNDVSSGTYVPQTVSGGGGS